MTSAPGSKQVWLAEGHDVRRGGYPDVRGEMPSGVRLAWVPDDDRAMVLTPTHELLQFDGSAWNSVGSIPSDSTVVNMGGTLDGKSLVFFREARSEIDTLRIYAGTWQTLAGKPPKYGSTGVYTGASRDIDAKLAAKFSQIRDEYGEDSGSAYFVMSIMLRAELGLLPEAREALGNYARQRHGMQHSAYFGDDILYVAAHATTMGVIPWAEWKQMRDAHLAKGADRDTLLDGRQRIWSEYFAIPVYEAEGAKEAYRVLPDYSPFIHRSERWPDHDRAIGNVFRRSGHPKEAIPYYERATASCTYEKLLERWPLSTGSRSSALAGRGKMAVCGNNPESLSKSRR